MHKRATEDPRCSAPDMLTHVSYRVTPSGKASVETFCAPSDDIVNRNGELTITDDVAGLSDPSSAAAGDGAVTNLDPAAFASVFDLITEHGVQTVGTPFAFEFLPDPQDPTAVRAELYQHREPVFDVMITPSGSRVADPKEKTGEEAAEDPAN